MDQPNTNLTPTAPDLTPIPIEMTPVAPAISPVTPAPEPVVPAEPTPTPISPPAPTPAPPAPVAPTPPPPSPVLEAVNPIRRLLDKAKEKIQFRKQAKLEKIMVFAKAQGGVTNDQVQKLLRVSDATTTRYLVQLTKSGRLRLVKAVGRGARYAPAQ